MVLVRNIGCLAVVPCGPVPGRSMRHVPVIEQAAIRIEDGRIAWFGPEQELTAAPGAETIDARGGLVIPGLIDCHTHAVFAGSREAEFVQRIEGASYAEIAERGGGIRVTVEAVRRASEEELLSAAKRRLARMLECGVTTIEIKSGYGLKVDDELKMLRVAARLREAAAQEIVATYLAAHTTPREFAGRADEYLEAVFADEVLARIRDEKLAEFCDVFCEKTAFDVEQARRVLLKAQRFGLTPRVHADQITQMGASRLAVELGAASADHLEHVDDASIAALQESMQTWHRRPAGEEEQRNRRPAGGETTQAGDSGPTIPVLLPGCSFFLGVPQAPARRLLDADLPVAIATDCNPGSSMIESLPLVLSIACTQMRMTPDEALIAATANAAAALRRHDRLGAIAVGMQADLVILHATSVAHWLYQPGRDLVHTVLRAGTSVYAHACTM